MNCLAFWERYQFALLLRKINITVRVVHPIGSCSLKSVMLLFWKRRTSWLGPILKQRYDES